MSSVEPARKHAPPEPDRREDWLRIVLPVAVLALGVVAWDLVVRLNDDLLALWQALGKTVVFVTHSVFESVYLSNRIVVMTPRPGRVFAEIAIDAPYPRDESFRTSAEYAGYCRKTSQALAAAIASGAGA